MRNKKALIVTLIVLLIGVLAAFGYNAHIKSQAVEGNKSIVVTVVNDSDNYKKEHQHKTDATSLGEALKEMNIVEVESSQYGDFLVGADGYKADDSKQQWWKIVVNGKDAEVGMDSLMINDGDKIELILIIGW